MRIAAVGLVATLALLAAGCGSGGGASATPLELVSQAVSKTSDATSSKFHMDITETIGPVGPLTMTADGVSDSKTRSAKMKMDMSAIGSLAGAQAGSASDWVAEAILDGSDANHVVEYMKLPALAKQIPGGKPWIKMDLSELAKLHGVNFSQILQNATQQDPTQALSALKSVGDVHEVGSEQLDGVDTTKYSGTLDPQKVVQKYGAGTGLGAMYEKLGTKQIPIEIWVDGDGYVRKFDETMSMQDPQAGHVDMKLAATMSDFGTPVDVTPPPADQTTDLVQLLKQK